MNHHYRDITDKLGPPLWWDEYAVPRYCDFAPTEVAYIYAGEAVLLLIECQSCGSEFRVAMTCNELHGSPSLATLIRSDEIHYGDPPNAECCAAGPTMNSVPKRVLEYWTNDGECWEWKRFPELERDIACEWAA